MKLQIKIKCIYGRDRIYPANDTAEKFSKLIGAKCFTEEHLRIIQELGYQIEQINAYQLIKQEETV